MTQNTATAIRLSEPGDAPRLFEIWLEAVRATHDFLTEGDIAALGAEVRAYVSDASLGVALDPACTPIGFIGMTGDYVDALFIDPAWHGMGIGRALIAAHDVRSVDVNEQNSGAAAFYAKLGFTIASRSETDESGRPFPLLHLVRAKA